jgi:hypothetical protein
MANPNDASGRAAERVSLNAKVAASAAAISAVPTGDTNGAQDLRHKLVESDYRLNMMTKLGGKSGFDTAFAYSGFALEAVST